LRPCLLALVARAGSAFRRRIALSCQFHPEWREFAEKAIYNRAAASPPLTLPRHPGRRRETRTNGRHPMFRILKALVTLVLFAFLGLVAYAYLGDLQPVQNEVSQPVELNVDQ
jgi:hypothetical protein